MAMCGISDKTVGQVIFELAFAAIVVFVAVNLIFF